MAKETKELKLKRKTITDQIEADYIARKKKYPAAEIPKYLKMSKIDLDQATFKNLTALKHMITEKEMGEHFANEQMHN